jgi:RNA polymerase sigma factor (sigma-70 family)
LRLATVILGTSVGANDVVQDAAIRAWTARGSFDPERSFRNWYLRIVANTARNRIRSFWRRSALELRYTSAATRVSETEESNDPAGLAIAADERALVIAAMNRLGRNDRLVIALRYFEHLSESEMAEVVGCSPGTIKSRLSRALDRLRRELGVLR